LPTQQITTATNRYLDYIVELTIIKSLYLQSHMIKFAKLIDPLLQTADLLQFAIAITCAKYKEAVLDSSNISRLEQSDLEQCLVSYNNQNIHTFVNYSTC